MILTEKAITRAVLDHWRARGVAGSLVASIPNAASFGQPGLTRGLPDLLVLVPGALAGFLELKTETGKLSEHQQHFISLAERAMVRAHVAYGLDEALTILESWGALKAQRRAA